MSSEDCSKMHDTGIWEAHLGQQKVYMQKLSIKKIKQRRFYMHESNITPRYDCVGATGPLYRSPKDPLSTMNSLNKVGAAPLVDSSIVPLRTEIDTAPS